MVAVVITVSGSVIIKSWTLLVGELTQLKEITMWAKYPAVGHLGLESHLN